VFGDFSQAAASTTRAYGGTGLGLGISRRLVQMMGGQLRLESALGRGSRFHFELLLPVADAADEPLAGRLLPSAAPSTGAGLAGVRLLVVEDNPVNQQVARELLRAQGAEVVLAGDGAEGVRRLATASPPFDAVLMDVQMPVMDGYDATREIRTRLGDTRTPIIAMTANAMAADREQCLAAGMDDHVAKPFDMPRLLAVLHQHLGGRDVPMPAPAAPAAPAPSPAPSLWDRRGALERLGGDAALLAQMVPLFCTNLRHCAEQIQALGGDAPPQDAMRLFHTLKGMASTMGADALAAQAAAAEQSLRSGAGTSAPALAAPMQETIARTLALLEAPAP
jgi:CheY-like chemotaxis protein/HPt (histidine-containing phosphotransfer) domain-containing protein